MKEFLHSVVDFFSALFFLTFSLLLVAAILFAGGWFVQVLMGPMTTTEYFKVCGSMLSDPGNTPAGRWFQEAMARVRG